jgi:hypothetical protein
MPLKRLSDVKRRDGIVPVGAMCSQIRLQDLGQDTWAKVSILGNRAEMTIPYTSGLKMNMIVAYEDRRFSIERVSELGLKQQMRLECNSSN